jgi:hypothetical protein
MCLVGRTEAPLGFLLLVVLEHLFHVEDCERPTGLVRERDPVALRRALDRKAHREGPRQPAGQVHVLDHALVVVPAHEAREGGEGARGEHVQVGELARGEAHRLEPLGAAGPLARALDELATVRPDELRLGREAHTRTSP